MRSADIVVVGAGSAGCVLAGRLSEDPGTRVLLLESGGRDRHPNIKIPAAFAKQFRTKLDWGFDTEPQPECDGRRLYTPRGRSLGGSSSMNAMLYVRGRPIDYDLWEAQGATGWGWDAVKPYFLKSEDFDRGADENHGAGGPLHVVKPRSPRKVTRAFLGAAEAVGIPYTKDYNGGEQDGAAVVQCTQYRGLRWSAADAFLRPALKRPNLEVVTGATVHHLTFEGDRCTGVAYLDGRGRRQEVRAEREVVLSAGAYGSPQLLMLSGIGPEEELGRHGIRVRHELPGVGVGLQDHPYCVCIWDLPGGGSLADAETLRGLLEYAARRSGPLASSVAEAFAFVRTRPGLPAPDIQMHFAPAYFSNHGFDTYDGHAVTTGPTVVAPKSRGWVRLASDDPTRAPRINPNVFSEPDDLRSMVDGVKLAREIMRSGPMGELIGKEIFPGPAAVDDTEIEADVRRRTELIYHPVGTCRIGQDEHAVVDPELRVRGLEGLRVCDASVMPVIPGGNTNAPVIMVGERGADLIRGRAGVAAATAAA